jgi:hypothetical protein
MKTSLVSIAVIALSCLVSCNPSGNQVYPEQNQTADNGVQVASCGEPGDYLAMMAAPTVIVQSLNGCSELNVITAIVKDEGAHSLANVCRDLMHMELYYSLSRSALEGLEGLASSNAGSNFELPQGVGRLVERRSAPSDVGFSEFFIQDIGGGGPNRGRYKVDLPFHLLDLSKNNRIGQNLGANVQLHYRWAKRFDKTDDVDPMVFSKETYTINFTGETIANAGVDQTIEAPNENSVVLAGTVNSSPAAIASVSWDWVDIVQNINESSSLVPPVISAPNNLSTNVTFESHANHEFVLTVTDTCGQVSRDTMTVRIRGTYDDPKSRNVFLLSGDPCGRDGSGRIMQLKNYSSESKSVVVRVFEDWTSWLSPNTPFAGSTNQFETTAEVPGNQVYVIGCSVEFGEGTTQADRVTRSYTVLREN